MAVVKLGGNEASTMVFVTLQTGKPSPDFEAANFGSIFVVPSQSTPYMSLHHYSF